MGGKSTNRSFGLRENFHIFELLSNTNWHERIFKTFCFRFEYKFYKNTGNDQNAVRYTITWKEFEKEMLNNYFEIETNDVHFFIHQTMEKFFENHGGEIRVFKVYMLYFPLVLHLNGMEGLNFVDLIFEKVIYNIEIEIKRKIMNENKHDTSEISEPDKVSNYNYNKSKSIRQQIENDNKSLNKSDDNNSSRKLLQNSTRTKIDLDITDVKTSRYLLLKPEVNLNNDNNISKNYNNEDKLKSDASSIYDKSTDNTLMKIYNEYFNKKNGHGSLVRTLPLKVFREIMFAYFQNNITNLLMSFKEVLRNFDESRYEDDKFIKRIKSFKHFNINVERFTSANVYKFIDYTIKNLAIKRINLPKFKDLKNLELTFDDIYLYIKLNPFFLNLIQCLKEFNSLPMENE